MEGKPKCSNLHRDDMIQKRNHPVRGKVGDTDVAGHGRCRETLKNEISTLHYQQS